MSDDIPPALPRLPVRSANSHKGDFGRILLVGGSLGMAGSISLAGMAALRSGAGLVRIASAKSARPSLRLLIRAI
ncbi:MAG: NAD(P)H-hydrate dehydratase [Pirellulaceae bacterium]